MKQKPNQSPPPAVQQAPCSQPCPAATTAQQAERDNNPWYLLTLTLLLVAPFAGVLFAPEGRVLGHPDTDNPSAYYFLAQYAARLLRDGVIPLWNPYVMLGVPFLGDGESSVFHPLSLLFLFMKTSVAINWLIAIAFLLTGLFFYGYLRALRLGRPAAWCGAVVWSFSNVMISRIFAGHLNILLTLISIPMVLMFWERYRTAGGVRYLLGISVGYGMMILAYYPQLLYSFSLFLLFYVGIQSTLAVVADRTAAQREGRDLLLLGAFILLGIGLGSIQLFPSLDFVSRSFRKEATIEFSGSFSFPPENLLTLIAPTFFGTRFTGTVDRYWGYYYFWEMWMYLGLLPLLMAVVGAWAAPYRRRTTLLGCGALFLLLGLGKNTDLFPLIYEYVPFFDVFRGSSKNTLLTLLCLVTLSAYGLDRLFAETDEVRRRRLRLLTAAAGGLLLLTALGATLLLLRDAEAVGSNWRGLLAKIAQSGIGNLSPEIAADPEVVRATAAGAFASLSRGMVLIALGVGLVTLLRPAPWRRFLFPAASLMILVDLLSVFLPLQRTFDKAITKFPEEIKEVVADFPYPPRILIPGNTMPNIAMRYRYSSPFGYMGNTLKRYNDFISLVQGLDPNQSRASSIFTEYTPHFRMLALDAVVLEPGQMTTEMKPIGRVGNKVLVAYDEIGQELPRAFLAAAPQYFAQKEAALRHVFADGADVLGSPAIERTGWHLANHPLAEDEAVRFISYKEQRVELEVRSRQPRELVLSSMYERNWKAWVNGTPSPVAPANYIFRAVQVPAGTSRVVFEYRPLAFYWGVAVSALSLATLVLIGIVAWLRSKPQRWAPDPAWAPIALSRCLERLGVLQRPTSRLTASVSGPFVQAPSN